MVVHPRTVAEVDAYLTRPAHAVALVGADGIGKTYLAQSLAARILGVDQEKLANYTYFYTISPDEGNKIGIDTAKDVVAMLRLKTTGTGTIRRVILIEHADCLTQEAQNALLKSIEEPPEDTVLLLTIANRMAVLPTIVSRLQTIQVHAPTKPQLQEFFASFRATAFDKAYFLSGGRPGLLHALLQGDDTHPLVQAIEQAKQLISADIFTRLNQIDDITKKKQSVVLVQAIEQYALAGIEFSADPRKTDALKRWANTLRYSSETLEQLAQNVQPKLALTNLFVHM